MGNDHRPLVSVVIPCFQSVLELDELSKALEQLRQTIELEYALQVIFVDDGSTDGTLDGLIALKGSAMFSCRIVVMNGNYGSYLALHAGIMQATGDVLVQLHADLQDPPAHIPEMLGKWKSGAKLVIGQRVGRDEGLLTQLFAGLYHRMVKRHALPNIPSGGYDLIVFDREIQDHLRHMDVKNINLVYLISWLNYPYETIPVRRVARRTGRSQWTFQWKVKLVIDTMVGFSYAPVRVFRLFATAQLIALPFFSAYVLLSGLEPVWKVIVLCFALWASLCLLGVALLAEYVWRILESSRKRPPYLINRVIG